MSHSSLPIAATDSGEDLFSKFLDSYEGDRKDPLQLQAGDVVIAYEFEPTDEASTPAYDSRRIAQSNAATCPLLLEEVERSRRRAAERSYPKHGVLATGLEMCGTLLSFVAILGLIGILGGLCALYFGVFVPFQLV